MVDTDGWGVGSEFNSCWFTLCRITLGWIGNWWLLRCDGLHSSDCVRSGSWDQSHSLSLPLMAALLLLCLFHAVLPRKYIYKEHSLRLNAVSHQMSFVGWQDVCLLQARLGRRGLSPEKQGRTKLWVHRSGVLGEKNQIEYHVKFYASLLKYIWANGPWVVQYSPPFCSK